MARKPRPVDRRDMPAIDRRAFELMRLGKEWTEAYRQAFDEAQLPRASERGTVKTGNGGGSTE